MTVLQTERLTLRPFILDDFEPLAAMSADPQVMRFLSLDGKPQPRFQAWQSFSALVGHWQLRGYGFFAVIEKASGEFVGRVGPWHPEGWPDFEIGWTLRSQYWGRGYATEAARKCIDFAFEELKRTHLISLIHPENANSIAVAQRLGESLEGEVILPHLPHTRILQYGLHRDEWRQRNEAR